MVDKVVHDFTGMLQMRHPYELGGAYWLFNMVYTQVSIFAVLYFKTKIQKKDSDSNLAIQDHHLLVIASTLLVLWLLAMVAVLIYSEFGYKHTFYQTLRGWAYTRALFNTGDNEYRMMIFTTRQGEYMHYADEIRDWLSEVWQELHETKPDWFSEAVISRIPNEFIPNIRHQSVRDEMKRASSRMKEDDGDDGPIRARRRSSLGDIMADALIPQMK